MSEPILPTSRLAPAQRIDAPVPPVWIVNAAFKLRRLLLRAADAVVPPYMAIYDRLMGTAHTMLIHSAARLCIPDLLANGPLSGAEIAARTGTNSDVMERVMLALVSIGVFCHKEDGRYANNRTSKCMITGAPGGIRGFAEFFGHEKILMAWNRLSETLQDGKRAFKEVHGQIVWDFLADDSHVKAAFAEGMSSMTELVSPAIAAAYPFESVHTVCDVGGGVGILLSAVLRKHTHLRGILFDLAPMIHEAKAYVDAAGLSDRVELHAGSFFEAVPRGADCYIMKTVLHNWDDEEALKILRSCRAAMDPNQRLLVCDFLVHKDAFSTMVPFMDLAGLMIFCGRERSTEKLRAMFSETGFTLGRVVPLPGVQAVYEAIAR
jgi:2-polyprenyl-3-methyl-5-hydroxy-6-metoxy-1,4-benzoquinol methylase